MFGFATGEDILTFLRVADKWQFDQKKKAGIEFLKIVGSPAQRIVAARRFEEARELLVPAFEELSRELVPPSERDGLLLNSKDLLILWYLQSYKRVCGSESHQLKYIKYLALEGGALGTFLNRPGT